MTTPSPGNSPAATVSVPLYRLAHSRSGDKGNISNLSLIAWDKECYDVLVEQVTDARVAQWFDYRHPARVTRYEIATLQAMNFVLEGVLDGGVNDALNLDAHGKSLSFHLLDLPVEVSAKLAQRLPNVPGDALSNA
ncbi:AtuA-related protein [Bordetella genomosp. 4]|uniref:AtuA-like ferredoxin-fold domain-containing protein n=1 Tax=Bordetella genomosp. 4 TaxID=463044 RepID=A0A261U2N7_9BORD|nr:hypothetical protein [Bordetella genomosp. 4]OZI49782.1 hypothetical protein CAL21_09490 [Bordetella genomosp. 4]OZI56224.1 hypothetical protein CAL20_12325 [Bordetella genomosp. 4]